MKKESKNNIQNKHQSRMGFSVPENYFENFQKNLEHKLVDSNLETVHSNLLGFEIPEDYFTQVSNRILEKTSNKETKVVSIYSRYKFVVVAVAASLLIMLSINYFNPIFERNETQIALEEVSDLYSVSFSDEDAMSFLFEEDEQVDKSISDYVVESLILEDALFLFPTLKDATLTSLFIEDKNLDVYLDDQLIDDLLIANLN